MKDALEKALVGTEEMVEMQTDRILAASFFRKRPLQAGSVALVVSLSDARAKAHGSHR